MKRSVTTWMIAAAALAVAAGSASAQTYKAEIPLSFQVQGKLMVPGSYQIRMTNSSTEIFHLLNVDTHSSALVVAKAKSDTPKALREGGNPVISFECTGGLCALKRIWNGQDSFVYNFQGLRLPPGEARAAVVNVTLTKAD